MAASFLVPVVFGTRTSAATTDPFLAAITIMGSGRLGPTASALLGLAGTVIGALSLRRATVATDTGARSGVTTMIDHRGAPAALVLGAIGLVLGWLFLLTADGGPGTGNGVVGSVAALVLGPSAIVLGGLATARRRDHDPESSPRTATDIRGRSEGAS